MYFPQGRLHAQGRSKPGEIVWSRIYVEGDALHMDIGRGGVVRLSDEETERRWAATTPQWPIMHAVLYGVSRDQLMAKHQANHIQVAYAPDAATARRALARKAAMARALGIRVNLCGDLERLARPAPGGEVPRVTRRCALGLDFGTASVRALVVETATGRERGSAVADYRHGVIETALPGSARGLPADWALQHPGD